MTERQERRPKVYAEDYSIFDMHEDVESTEYHAADGPSWEGLEILWPIWDSQESFYVHMTRGSGEERVVHKWNTEASSMSELLHKLNRESIEHVSKEDRSRAHWGGLPMTYHIMIFSDWSVGEYPCTPLVGLRKQFRKEHIDQHMSNNHQSTISEISDENI